MWIITGQRDFYFVCGIFVWTIPRPWSSRSSNIEVRQTSITSHLTTFYHVACVAGFKREKGRGGILALREWGEERPISPPPPFPFQRLHTGWVKPTSQLFLLSRTVVRSCAWRKKYSYAIQLRCLLHHSTVCRHATLLPTRREESCVTT